MSGKYYPNNWQEYKDAPDEMFEPHTFEEIMSWKVAGWELPSSVCCIIRAETKGKVKEFVYQKQHAAENKVKSLMAEVQSLLSVLIQQSILFHPITPMSLISIDQYYELAEDYPELAQLIHIHDDTTDAAEDFIGYTSGD